MNDQKFIGFLFGVALAWCLAAIWLLSYFLTGDGPCHLYNAAILHDIWSHSKDTAFYLSAYHINYAPNPNWLSTFLLASLLFVVKGVVAEKLLLSIYVLLFVGGFYLLLKKVAGDSLWSLTIFLFVFTHVLTKGFYNFSFSIAFYFWVVWAWLRYLERKNFKNGVVFFLFICLIFFSHLLAFIFAAITCFALTISYALTESEGKKKWLAMIMLAITLMPFIALSAWFTGSEGGMGLQLQPHLYRLVELAQFKHAINYSHAELLWTTVAGCVLLLTLLACFIPFKSLLSVKKNDGLLWAWLVILIVYLISPERVLGREMDMSVRVQLFVMILGMLVISTRMSAIWLRNACAVTLFGCFVILSMLRFSSLQVASNAENELMSAAPYIRPYTTVLPLNFSPEGIGKNGKQINDWNASFRHATQYFGIEKPLIVLDNYEANAGYFPIQWKAAVNPYRYLSIGNGIEGIPPYAQLHAYTQRTGISVDYIVMWCYDPSFLSDANFRMLYAEINTSYHIVYNSSGGRVIVYEKNG